MSRSRLFTITDYVLDKSFWETFCPANNVTYFLSGLEVCPNTQRQHLQAFIYFSSQRTLTSVIKKLKPRHIEIANGNVNQNFKYCSKDNNIFYEYGTKPSQGKRNDIQEVVNEFSPGNFDDIVLENPQLYCQYNRGLEKLYSKKLKSYAKNRAVPEIIVLWGPTGVGKTRHAVDAGATVISYENGFFSGYSGEKIICLDEFDHEKMDRTVFLRFTDRYYYELNIKGDSIPLCAETIYITSNYDPKCWYNKDLAVQRRLSKVTRLGPPLYPDSEIESEDEPLY